MKKETKLSISQVFVYLVLLFVFVFFSVLTKTFLSTKNLLNICRQVSMTGICAVGMTMVLLTGGIDISIGSVIALSGVVSAKLINDLGNQLVNGAVHTAGTKSNLRAFYHGRRSCVNLLHGSSPFFTYLSISLALATMSSLFMMTP